MPTQSLRRLSTSMMGLRFSRSWGSLSAFGIGHSSFQCQWSGIMWPFSHNKLSRWWMCFTVVGVQSLIWANDRPVMPGDDFGARAMASSNSESEGQGVIAVDATCWRRQHSSEETAVQGEVKPAQRASVVQCNSSGSLSLQYSWNCVWDDDTDAWEFQSSVMGNWVELIEWCRWKWFVQVLWTSMGSRMMSLFVTTYAKSIIAFFFGPVMLITFLSWLSPSAWATFLATCFNILVRWWCRERIACAWQRSAASWRRVSKSSSVMICFHMCGGGQIEERSWEDVSSWREE